jgi:hypothetical protein
MAAEGACIQDPKAVWVQSTMTEAKIQVLVDRRLFRPKAGVEYRAAAGEQLRQGAGRLRLILRA